ncbi:MAG: hypothetical protein ACJ8C4_03925 [Gemmataceae bacterium]
MRRIANIGLHAFVVAAGLWIAFRPTLGSGFTLLQTDPGDTLLNHFILEHSWKCLSDPAYPGSLWSPPCFYPEQGTLAYSENLLGTAPIYWSCRFFASELPAYQAWMLTVAGLTYVAMAWTLRRFGVGHLLAALGAFVFAFGMPRVNQLGHQQLLPAMFTPPAVYYAWRLMESSRVGVLAGLLTCALLQLLAGIYLGWFLMFGLAVFAGARLWRDPETRERLRAFAVERWRSVMACLASAAIAGGMLFYPYVEANRGFRRHYGEVALMLPTPHSWFSPTPSSWWANVLPQFEGPLNHEHHDFSGLVLPALVLGAVWSLQKSRPVPPLSAPHPGDGGEREQAESTRNQLALARTALLSAAIFVLLSLSVFGISPWRLVYALVPGAKAIRAVSRIYIVVYLFAWIGALIIADRRLRGWRRGGIVASGVLLLVGMAEQYHPRLPAFDPRPFYAEVDRLADEMRGSSAAYVEPDPEVQFWVSQLAAMWAGLKADVPVINGYSGRTPKGYPDEKMILDREDVVTWINCRPVTPRPESGRGVTGLQLIGPVRLAHAYPAPVIPANAPVTVRALDFRPYRSSRHVEIIDSCLISPTKRSAPREPAPTAP